MSADGADDLYTVQYWSIRPVEGADVHSAFLTIFPQSPKFDAAAFLLFRYSTLRVKMAAGSKRSPPPFPDSEDQDPEPELDEDEDSDEGADIFTGSVSKLHSGY